MNGRFEPAGPYHTDFAHQPIREFPSPSDNLAIHPHPPPSSVSGPGAASSYYSSGYSHSTQPPQLEGGYYAAGGPVPYGSPPAAPALGMVSDKYSQNALAHPVIPLVDIKTVDPQARGPTTFLRRRQPWVVWLFTLGQVIALVVELIINHQLTGSVIQTSPFNYMIGPSTATLIYTGARFVPCMRPGPYSNQPAPCLQDGGIYSTNTTCTWEQLCGFDGFKPDGTPDQGFRFVLPIFLHAGVLHLLFNLLHQLSYGSQLEREIGWWRFGAIYILSGIGGIILGSILSPPLFASVGASGALFGLLACQLLEILFNWHRIHNPCLELSKFVIVIGLSFVLGLLPGIDNFAHIGGFIAGLFAGLIFLSNLPFDKYTKWIRLVAWVISVAVIITLFTTGLVTFYDKDDLTNICPWCKNLTCAAIFDSCKAMYN